MSLTNPKTVVTEERLSEFYQKILPYLGGSAAAGFTPVGSIIAMMSNSAPANYLACDGATYNISDYPELADHFFNEFGSRNFFGGNGTTTFAVPDLRGEFIRGTGTNSHTDQGNGANVGTHQDGTKMPDMNFGNTYLSGVKGSTVAENADWTSDSTTSNVGGITLQALTSISAKAKFTARPTNTSVLYCIATKNIYLNPSLDYSTSEKIVGTWIDGKPLYQKTINFGTLPNNTTKTVSSGTSVSSVKRLWGFAYNNNTFVNLPHVGVGDMVGINSISLYASGSSVGVKTGTDRTDLTTCYITIQYTKSS